MDFAWREGTLPTCGCVGYFTVVIPVSGIPQNAKFQNGVHLGALSPTIVANDSVLATPYYRIFVIDIKIRAVKEHYTVSQKTRHLTLAHNFTKY